jgi:hypothetical protein
MLEDCKEEAGKNCFLGGYQLIKPLNKGLFTRSGKFQFSNETIKHRAVRMMTQERGNSNDSSVVSPTMSVNKVNKVDQGKVRS